MGWATVSVLFPDVYHWSRAYNRKSIEKVGLRPTCPTAVWERPAGPVKNARHLTDVELDDEDFGLLGVCLSPNPRDAWLLSIRILSEPGEEWDLWQVFPDVTDEIHYRPSLGNTPDEIRIVNRIPKSRVWYVASRTVLPHERRRQ